MQRIAVCTHHATSREVSGEDVPACGPRGLARGAEPGRGLDAEVEGLVIAALVQYGDQTLQERYIVSGALQDPSKRLGTCCMELASITRIRLFHVHPTISAFEANHDLAQDLHRILGAATQAEACFFAILSDR